MVDVSAEAQALDEAALAAYGAFCRHAAHGPAQHPLWLGAWRAGTDADMLLVTIRQGAEPAILLALEVVAKGPFRVARFPGGGHANGNFAASARAASRVLSPADARAVADAVREARPDIDLIHLSRQNPDFDGVANPLSRLAAMSSPNLSLAARLDGGFEALLVRAGRKRKVRHYKQRLTRLNNSGGFRLIEAATPEEVTRLLDAFFVLKGRRLQKMGIAHTFADPALQAFFRKLFIASLAEKPSPFVLHGLEVGGKIVAINGLSVTGHSFVWEFCGIDDTDPSLSPGYFLNYNSIEWACRMDKQLFDFSVGDEPFKRSWSDVETVQFETLLPLGAKGRALAFYERSRAAAVRRVKSNRVLWAAAKTLRERLGGHAPQDASAESSGETSEK